MKDIYKSNTALSSIMNYLPPLCRKSIVTSLLSLKEKDHLKLSEIRLRKERQTVVCIGKSKLRCDYVMSGDDIRSTVREMCLGSVYAFQNTIKEGYIPLPCGGRAGVVGDIVDSKMEIAVETITAINIRIPHHIRGVCAKVYDLFLSCNEGLLIYSSPSVGKTTLLRDLAIELSRGKTSYNVALIDSRRELDDGFIPSDCMIDTYSGYPKSLGIEIAVRTMSSDVIICDEISYREIESIKYTVLCSVPVIAAVHAKNKSELFSRKDVNELIRMGAFSYIIGINRNEYDTYFNFEIDKIK